MKKSYLSLIACLYFLLTATALAEESTQKLTIVLDWFVNPNHAPLFVAEQQGFFKEQGLEVRLISPADTNDPPKLVAAKKAELALTYEPSFIDQIEQGLPLITIGTLIDKPLNCLLTLEDGPIHALSDLKDRRIGSSTGGVTAILLKSLLQKNGLSLKQVKTINVRHNGLQALLAGKVDAITGVMRNLEALQVEQYGHKPRLFLPEKNGLPTYSELIFIVNKNSLQDPQARLAYQHFLLALQKALVYLKNHPDESWQAFAKKYPALNNDLNRRAWYVSLPYFSTQPNKLQAEEWRAFIKFMRQNDLIHSTRPLSEYIIELRP